MRPVFTSLLFSSPPTTYKLPFSKLSPLPYSSPVHPATHTPKNDHMPIQPAVVIAIMFLIDLVRSNTSSLFTSAKADLSNMTPPAWDYFCFALVVLGMSLCLLGMRRRNTRELELEFEPEFDAVSATNEAVVNVQTWSPRTMDCVLRRSAQIPSRDLQTEMMATVRHEPADWTGTTGPGTPTPRLWSATTASRSHISTARLSTPDFQTPHADAFRAQNFAVLAREAPEVFKTLRNVGLLNADGLPTKRLLEDETLPWGKDGDEDGTNTSQLEAQVDDAQIRSNLRTIDNRHLVAILLSEE
ncbi:hypothetical protein K504DRAFT_532895 [Pleomassaria siparia CBS 279.74]|uniref:Uncharacterized protein n=1 Tax=Pleomassaria siparia CBS 279.74 TaxID=1314801 RepID=A0A6G1KEA9_9PLEO|nr:hypothetical protein K504DRAFT_532895 [Pleomassaria siparia CBS 279.74]